MNETLRQFVKKVLEAYPKVTYKDVKPAVLYGKLIYQVFYKGILREQIATELSADQRDDGGLEEWIKAEFLCYGLTPRRPKGLTPEDYAAQWGSYGSGNPAADRLGYRFYNFREQGFDGEFLPRFIRNINELIVHHGDTLKKTDKQELLWLRVVCEKRFAQIPKKVAM